MNNFNLPPSYYEPSAGLDPNDFGYVSRDEVPDIEHASEMLKGVIKAFYESGNIMDLENCLEELGDCLDVKLPDREPVLERKGFVSHALRTK